MQKSSELINYQVRKAVILNRERNQLYLLLQQSINLAEVKNNIISIIHEYV